MINHEPLNGEYFRGVQVPNKYYGVIQQLAYKYNTSTRIISTLLVNAGIYHYKKDSGTLGNIVTAYKWYQENKDGIGLNKDQRKLLKETKECFTQFK